MNLENQVVSLELAQKMMDLGFWNETIFYWHSEGDEKIRLTYFEDLPEEPDLTIPAYTVAELGEMLPDIRKLEYDNKIMMAYKNCNRNKWTIIINGEQHNFYFEANARASILIYLKENNLI